MSDRLTWDDSYAIARSLISLHLDADLERVSLQDIFQWTSELPDFDDDPALCNDAILLAIYREWFEEVNSI